MNRMEFEKKCAAEGYGDTVERRMEAGEFKEAHAHEFDAYVLILDGEMTISRNGKPEIFRAGDICTMPAGTMHTETSGPAGAHYLAGRRHPAHAR